MATTHDVSSLVTEAAVDRPDALAVVETDGRGLTWAELEDEIARIATGLGAFGVVAGQRVMLVVGNRIEFITAYLGTLRAQVVAVPVNPGATSGELARMAADSGSRLLIADPGSLDEVQKAFQRFCSCGIGLCHPRPLAPERVPQPKSSLTSLFRVFMGVPLRRHN